MTNKGIIETKIGSIEGYLEILKKHYQHRSQDEIERELFIKTSLERHLYLLTQETIGLAEAVVAYREFRRPDSYSAAFEILHENNIISFEVMKSLVQMVGFRNTISHDYKKLNFKIVYDVLQNKLNDINDFVLEIKKVL